jgi:hypothetical protein
VVLAPTRLPVLERHRERQNEFLAQFGPAYRADLDLIFANPDGTPLRPNSVSGTVSRICKQVGGGPAQGRIAPRFAPQPREPTGGERRGSPDHLRTHGAHSSVRTTADIYAHAMRGRDDAAARVWDAIQERDRAERSKSVN